MLGTDPGWPDPLFLYSAALLLPSKPRQPAHDLLHLMEEHLVRVLPQARFIDNFIQTGMILSTILQCRPD